MRFNALLFVFDLQCAVGDSSDIRAQSLIAVLALASSHTCSVGSHSSPLSFLQFAFAHYEVNPACTGVVAAICRAVSSSVAAICKDSSASTSSAEAWACVSFARSITSLAMPDVKQSVDEALSAPLHRIVLYERAAVEFNAKPKRGIQVLERAGPLTPSDAAHFMRFARHLSKDAVRWRSFLSVTTVLLCESALLLNPL